MIRSWEVEAFLKKRGAIRQYHTHIKQIMDDAEHGAKELLIFFRSDMVQYIFHQINYSLLEYNPRSRVYRNRGDIEIVFQSEGRIWLKTIWQEQELYGLDFKGWNFDIVL